jgi:BCCT family betaine/carnitine transporter
MNMGKPVNYRILFFPLLIILLLTLTLLFFPEVCRQWILNLQNILVNKMGFFYILMGLFALFCCIYLACSKYGRIRLGETLPIYGNFRWGAMIFTSTMAADILYWSLIEWGYYYSSNPTGAAELSEAQRQVLASSYPLFHWGPVPWAFYILPAVCYAFLFFNSPITRGGVYFKRQTLSEACRPLLGDRVNGWIGHFIDIFSIVGFLGGTATTFSLATPLLSDAVGALLHIPNGKELSIFVLCMTGFTFTLAVMLGMAAIAKLAAICVGLFVCLLLYVFICGPSLFILESSLSGIGYMVQNFIVMATWTDPLRLTGDGSVGFPQQWTIFYWAYWIAWFVATPFFIAKISEGRTIRQMISGSFFYGIAGTFTSFCVFGNFGLYLQTHGYINAASLLASGESPSKIILGFFSYLPANKLALALLSLAMIAFYASTFDAITLVVAGFCRKSLEKDEYPEPWLRIFWSLVFILLPIALLWSESTLSMLQTLSIAAAFPLSWIWLFIVFGFIKSLRNFNF